MIDDLFINIVSRWMTFGQSSFFFYETFIFFIPQVTFFSQFFGIPKTPQNGISGAILFNHIDGQIYMCKGHIWIRGSLTFDWSLDVCMILLLLISFNFCLLGAIWWALFLDKCKASCCMIMWMPICTILHDDIHMAGPGRCAYAYTYIYIYMYIFIDILVARACRF